jgi:hypothetical protein
MNMKKTRSAAFALLLAAMVVGSGAVGGAAQARPIGAPVYYGGGSISLSVCKAAQIKTGAMPKHHVVFGCRWTQPPGLSYDAYYFGYEVW